MIIEGDYIYPEKGFILRRKFDGEIVGKKYFCGYLYYRNGKKLDEPYLEKPEDFNEIPEDMEKVYERRKLEDKYPGLVDTLIRQKYSQSDELAIQRQRDAKPEKFQEYYDYCEECKKEAKRILGLEEPEPTPPNDEQPSEETIEESPENQEKTE